MLDLVFYTDNTLKAEPYTTSEIIANNTNNSRVSVRRLIEKHIDRLKQFGKVEFEMQPLPSGQKAKVYKLNEQQATLLITFLDNSDIVANFKTLLVKQFYEMRDELTKRNINRAIEKPVKKTLMDCIKKWKYASKYAYSNINRLLIKGATGLSIKALKKERGDAKAALDLLTSQEQEKYKQLEQKVIAYIEANFDYQLIKALLTGKEIKFIYQGAMQDDKLTIN
ncbi:putative phage protein [Ligilactobacillus salivarius GJ-24]|uniref:Putative phage protein n=1 Tax=Ligilactobacillus salivarius GJ-24 TaxID=1041521 RepID=F7QUT2_9LACO|nr:Rha family transcriptional regulator [Ligilactobacillus salivarius]EGM50909.1 putative phage protein [Ligilactobacillus salivarius GJ-24]